MRVIGPAYLKVHSKTNDLLTTEKQTKNNISNKTKFRREKVIIISRIKLNWLTLAKRSSSKDLRTTYAVD